MKQVSFILLFIISTLTAVSQTYYVYTARVNGNWNNMNTWNVGTRTDGVPKTKVVIPAAFTVSVDNGVNSFPLGNVEINIHGGLAMTNGTNIPLSAASSIELIGTGRITGTNNAQVISIGGVPKFDGSKDFTKTGASIANATTGISPNGFASTLVLPVKLISFTVNTTGMDAIVKWTTASEIYNDYFAVERSEDGNNWNVIATVNGSENTNSNTSYVYTDKITGSSFNYYRLKQIDLQGNYSYSEVRKTTGEANKAASAYISDRFLKIRLTKTVSTKTTVSVFNANGQVVSRKVFTEGREFSIALDQQSSGPLFVNINDSRETNQTIKLMF
ncbi:MAG: hypothetical protein EOP49_08520 [Sphingobacteriales bacterium]|nr:MAG: hypothetical protein EOP49_08520 [Sphingobacteriales bacterium]